MKRGLKHFFPVPPVQSDRFTVRGIGVREVMRAGVVDRPAGTGDYLFMLFYEPVDVGVDGAVVAVPAHTLMLWTPSHGHYYGNRDRVWRHSWVHCQGQAVEQLLALLALPIARPIEGVDPAAFERYLVALYEELTGPFVPDAAIATNHLDNCLREVRRRHAPRVAAAPPTPFVALKTYLETHYDEPVRLGALARRMKVTPQYLSARFRQLFGMSPIQYVIQQRLQRAAYLLRDQNLSVGEVGARVGYDDVFQFSKMFKRQFGMSPRALRGRLEAPADARRRS